MGEGFQGPVYVWLSHSAAHEERSQHCQSAVLQHKIKIQNKWFVHIDVMLLKNSETFCFLLLSNFVVIVVQLLSRVNSLQPQGLQHARPSCVSPSPRACSNSCPFSWRCHPAISSSVPPSPHALIPFQHQGLFQWVSSLHQVAKVLEFQLQQQSFQWIFRVDFF